jgi:hypothetical protein
MCFRCMGRACGRTVVRYAIALGTECRTYGAVPAYNEEEGIAMLPDKEGLSWLRSVPQRRSIANDPQAIPGIAEGQRNRGHLDLSVTPLPDTVGHSPLIVELSDELLDGGEHARWAAGKSAPAGDVQGYLNIE